jgi:hypothetical protein
MKQPPELNSEEQLLHTQTRVRAFAARDGETHALYPAIPFLLDWDLFVTDSRLHVASILFGLCTKRTDYWFPGKGPDSKTNVIRSVANSGGLRLTIETTETCARRGTNLVVLRFAFKEAPMVAKLLLEHMGPNDHIPATVLEDQLSDPSR